ncbi:hypothetical protein FSW04_18880 [Baekduia soli]|uniref:Uncharacterized protein n=1 Tax=Baekduia soli TaxID=496014 RepID=A0A5B8U9Y6_9ACTN|nr:hypothetical protein [Baekduia soli]QEC49431.1 hypothetical protein FSW04_18880 [Baekduia soli]
MDAQITGRERVVSGLFIDYWTVRRDPDGVEQKVLARASRGDLIVLSPAEESRLDELGMLGERGWTAEDVEASIERTRLAMVAQNQRESHQRSLG